MTARPRVLFLNRFFHPDHSATAQLLADLAFDLARDWGDVIVITSRLRYDDATARLPAREIVNGVEVRRVLTTGFGRAGLLGRAVDLASFYLMAGLALLFAARRGDVIVAKTDPPLLSIVAALVAGVRRARLINWLQDLYPEVASALGVPGLQGRFGRVLAGWRDLSLRKARCNVVLGERMAARLAARQIPAGKVEVIANWSDEDAITPVAHASNPLREEWGLHGRFVVGYSGNLGRAHEWATMFEAARLLQDDPRIVFLMIGGGHNTGELKARVEATGLTNVLFQPYQPLSALAASLSAADVHWLSLKSEMEGLIVPSKAYGVLAAGRAILAVTDADGEVARLTERYGCGLQLDIGDHIALAAAIRALAQDPERVRDLGAAARRAATEDLSRTSALARWRAVITAATKPG